MLLLIDDRLLIEDVQERFSDCFQALKIEFYSAANRDGNRYSDEYLINPKCRIRDIRRTHVSNLYEIKSWDTVNKVETDFKKIYGLNAKVFRHEDGSWIEANDSEYATLQQQNSISQNVRREMLQQEEMEEYVLL